MLDFAPCAGLRILRLGDDPAFGDPGDGIGDQIDVVPVERTEVGVGERRPLATECICWSELFAELAILDLICEVPAADLLDAADQERQPRVVDHPGSEDEVGEHRRDHADCVLRERHSLKHSLHPFRDGSVELRHHPDGCALVDVQVRGPLGQLRHEL